jgi:hypothetical protein
VAAVYRFDCLYFNSFETKWTDTLYSISILGPAVAIVNGKSVLAGVTSFGYQCANNRNPGLYARVSSAVEWIFNNTDAKSWQCPL